MDRHRLVAAALTASLIGTLLAAPASAAEYVRALHVVTAVSAANSDPVKSVTAVCSGGQRPVGGGFFIDGVTAGQVTIERLWPRESLVHVRAQEVQPGTKVVWWIRAYALCADPIPGYEIVSSATGAATCPVGKRPSGGGMDLVGGNGEVIVDRMRPSTTAVIAHAVEDVDGASGAWTLTTYAICVPTSLAGIQLFSQLTVSNTSDKAVAFDCPSGRPVSAGWDIQTRSPGLVVIELASFSPTPWPEVANVVARKIGTVFTGNWALETTTVCVGA